MKKRNRLATCEAPLESRVMLAGSVASGRFSARNGQIVAQETELQGNAGLSASLNGSEIANETSGTPARGTGSAQNTGSSGSRRRVRTTRTSTRNGVTTTEILNTGGSVQAQPAVTAGESSAPANSTNRSTFRISTRGGEVAVEENLAPNARVTANANGERVFSRGFGAAPVQAAPAEAGPITIRNQQDPTVGEDGRRVRVGSARVVVVGNKVVEVDVESTRTGSFNISANGEQVASGEALPDREPFFG